MIGEILANYDPNLPFDNHVPTLCRSTDLDSLDIREYYPRYLLHLPDGVTLPQIDVHIADFTAISSLGVELMSRSWISPVSGTFWGGVSTESGVSEDTTLAMLNLSVSIDNQIRQYGLKRTLYDNNYKKGKTPWS